MELMQANAQWATRPDDQRFTSLTEMAAMMRRLRSNSDQRAISSRALRLAPAGDEQHRGLKVETRTGALLDMTHWSFGQVAQLAGAPANYLRSLPSELSADCVNYGLTVEREVKDIGVLVTRMDDGNVVLRAATGPQYGRVWNSTIVDALIDRFGDGVNGHFRVPGEFGQRVEVTKDNTTLYASDRDLWVFLADEDRRIEMPNRRDGRSGSLARGFFLWNSEVGSQTFGVATFLFDYVCCNRIVWGAEGYREIRIRHTASAPDKWVEQVAPALEQYAKSSTQSITDAVTKAQKSKVEKIDDFLRQRFTRAQATAIQAAHLAEEDRPIETLWDAATGITAFAKSIKFQDERVLIEREAGKVLDLAIG